MLKQHRRQDEVVDKIHIAVRVRPPLDYELQRGHTFNLLQIDQENKIVK
jgi:hypothetical protein